MDRFRKSIRCGICCLHLGPALGHQCPSHRTYVRRRRQRGPHHGCWHIFFNANVNGDTGATHHNIDLDCSGGATTSSSLTLAGTTIRNPTGAANVTCIKVNSFDQVNIAGITHHDTNTKLFNLSSINRRERICGVSSASTVASTFSTTPKAVASAPTVTLPDHDSFFYQVTGSTQIDTITASWPGRVVILKFGAGGVIVSESGNVNLISTFTGSDEATLTLSCDGTDWYEVARAFLSAALYRSSIGLGTADSPQLTGIELSHATANTLTGLSGDAFIEGNSFTARAGQMFRWQTEGQGPALRAQPAAIYRPATS